MILPQILALKPAFSALQTGLSSVHPTSAGAALHARPTWSASNQNKRRFRVLLCTTTTEPIVAYLLLPYLEEIILRNTVA